MRYQHLVLYFVFSMSLFVGLNYVVWKTVTEDLITNRHYDGGDLARMGYLPASKIYRHNVTDLPRRHIPLKEYDGRPVDMAVVGDSFSNGGGGGYNRFYQDYLASQNGADILNIPRHNNLSPLVSVARLMDSGFLKRSGARYVLLGVSEKAARELSETGDSADASSGTLQGIRYANYDAVLPRTNFINNGNFKYLLNSLLYRFSRHALFSQVYQAQLTAPLFSSRDRSSLLYLRYRDIPSHDLMVRMNGNLNRLAQCLKLQGITLIFMPCVDKYNLYHPYLQSAPHAPSRFFEELRPLPRGYLLVDTKEILSSMLQRGETDVFYPDDTHWSWKASREIARSMQFLASPRRGNSP